MDPLDRDPLILIHDAARLMRTRFDQLARSHDMTRAQWVILARLHRQPGLSQNELAILCDVEPITIARHIDRLEARGYLERRSDPADRRIKRLHLLPAAQSQFAEMGRMRDIMSEEAFSHLTSDEREQLTNILFKIKEKLSANTAGAQKLAVVEE